MMQTRVEIAANLTVPTIHLNGTSKERLLEALKNASNSLEAAFQAIKETAPNGRDYYLQSDNAYGKAQEQYLDRLRRLDSVKDEIDAMAIAIESN